MSRYQAFFVRRFTGVGPADTSINPPDGEVNHGNFESYQRNSGGASCGRAARSLDWIDRDAARQLGPLAEAVANAFMVVFYQAENGPSDAGGLP